MQLIFDRIAFQRGEGKKREGGRGGILNSRIILGLLKEYRNHKLSVNPAQPTIYIPKALTLVQGSHLNGNNFPIPSEPGVLGGTWEGRKMGFCMEHESGRQNSKYVIKTVMQN